jgi:hypothetical protein
LSAVSNYPDRTQNERPHRIMPDQGVLVEWQVSNAPKDSDTRRKGAL